MSEMNARLRGLQDMTVTLTGHWDEAMAPFVAEVLRRHNEQVEKELATLLDAFPGLEWQICEGDYELLWYRAYEAQRDHWLHVRFSADGERWALVPVASEIVDQPDYVSAVMDMLERKLASQAGDVAGD